MKLASIEIIKEFSAHPNADSLIFAHVLGYKCIVRKEANYKVGGLVVFIQPDSVLPETEWSKIYRAKSNRVKAIRLRGQWSEGIIEDLHNVGLIDTYNYNEGDEVSIQLGITKYEPPVPQDLQAKGGLPFDIPITDEERYQNINPLPYGEIVDVTLKRDGKSWTAFAIKRNDIWHTGICGRRLEYKLDCENDYTKFKYLIYPLELWAVTENTSLVVRGEITGAGVQSFKNNPHCIGNKELSIFSVYLPDEKRYAGKGDKFYYPNVAAKIGAKTIEMLETGVVLTSELIKKYAEDLTTVNGLPFEGVVIKGKNFSFKVINKDYDSKK